MSIIPPIRLLPGQGIQIIGERSRAEVCYKNTIIRLNAGSRLMVDTEDSGGLLRLVDGVFHFFSRAQSGFLNLDVGTVLAGNRKTEFLVEVNGGDAEFIVLEGSITLTPNDKDFDAVEINAGQIGFVSKEGGPVTIEPIPDVIDAIQWLLY